MCFRFEGIEVAVPSQVLCDISSVERLFNKIAAHWVASVSR